MPVTASQAVSIGFTVVDIDQLLVNADVLPTAVLYRNGVETLVVVTVANTGTGRYSASWTNAGYSTGDQLALQVSALILDQAFVQNVWQDSVWPVPPTESQNAAAVRSELASELAEIGKIPRAATAIPAGQYRLTIQGGQAANVTPSEVP